MSPLRPPLRPVSLPNRYFGYIVTVILTGYAKAILKKEKTKSCEGLTILFWVCA